MGPRAAGMRGGGPRKSEIPKGEIPKGEIPKGEIPKGEIPKGEDRTARRPAATTSTEPTPPEPGAPPASTTRAVYRLLEIRGLKPDEAARLTAFLFGLPTRDLRWSLEQLNRLLFLRRLRQAGAFEDGDGSAPPP